MLRDLIYQGSWRRLGGGYGLIALHGRISTLLTPVRPADPRAGPVEQPVLILPTNEFVSLTDAAIVPGIKLFKFTPGVRRGVKLF